MAMQVATAAAFQQTALPLASQLLFSSTSSVWSQSGSAHYASANAFLDGHSSASQLAGLPATAVQFGPFAGAGMAAAHVDGLAALGLKSLLPVQIRESHLVAGTSSQLLYARIDASRFARIYSAKGRWALLDQLLLAPSAAEVAEPHGAAAAPLPKALGKPDAGMQLEQVVQAVRRAAADILGEELDSKLITGLPALA